LLPLAGKEIKQDAKDVAKIIVKLITEEILFKIQNKSEGKWKKRNTSCNHERNASKDSKLTPNS
jgi:hypothetical protein